MKGIIWGKTLDEANNQLKELTKKYAVKGFSIQTITQQGFIFDNGDEWITVKATENQRAYKCDVSYVSTHIDRDFVNTIIRHCTFNPSHNILYYGW